MFSKTDECSIILGMVVYPCGNVLGMMERPGQLVTVDVEVVASISRVKMSEVRGIETLMYYPFCCLTDKMAELGHFEAIMLAKQLFLFPFSTRCILNGNEEHMKEKYKINKKNVNN